MLLCCSALAVWSLPAVLPLAFNITLGSHWSDSLGSSMLLLLLPGASPTTAASPPSPGFEPPPAAPAYALRFILLT